MRNRNLVMSLMAVAALALIAWPVYAHCGKCAGSAKEMVTAMDTGKVTLGSAITAAEAASKGKAVAAHGDIHGGKLHFDVFVLVGDKLQRVEVDAAGKAGTPAEAKEIPIGHVHEKKPPTPGG